MSISERFQITIPAKPEDGHEWVSAKSQRVNTGNPQPSHGEKFNFMPIGYDATSEKDKFVQGYGGNTDVTGQTAFEPKTFVRGFKRREMKSTDDQYTGEMVDHYYGEAKDEDGNVGFVERNNYCDRI